MDGTRSIKCLQGGGETLIICRLPGRPGRSHILRDDPRPPQENVLRKPADRVRHAISFELSGLLIVMSAGILFFNKPAEDVGAIAAVASLIAAVWAFAYNYFFDVALLRLQGRVQKTVAQRVVHAILFEASLLVMILPFVAWHLQLSLIDAFLMDAALASFYIVYAFCFNWAYDYQFPVVDESASPAFAMGSACMV